jgi:proline iminopeptidase
VYHFAQGTGEPVIMLHGGPGYPIRIPWPGLKQAASTHRFYYYDQRGCGKSTKPFDRFASTNYYENMMQLDRRLGIAAQLADIERIRRILGEEKIILIGHSFGGLFAALYAAEFPEHVKALVLVAPAALLVMPADDGGLFETTRQLLPPEMQTEFDGYMARYFDFGNIFTRSEKDLADLMAEFGRYYAVAAKKNGFAPPPQTGIAGNGGWMAYAQYFGLGKRHDYRDAMKKVAAPVLVIHGEKDLQTESASRAFANAFSTSQFKIVHAAGHFPQYEQPEEFGKIVSDFLIELE